MELHSAVKLQQQQLTMSLTLVYGNRSAKNPPTFFTPLDGRARADLFKIIKVYQGLKSLCKSFVGAAILRSIDGTKMAVYEQWSEDTDFKALADPVAHPEMIKIREGSEKIQHNHEHRNLELVMGECTPQLPDIFTKDHVIHLDVFKTQPNRFEKLHAQCLASIKEKLSAASSGLFAYSIHRSLDGTKLAIVGHWKSSLEASQGMHQDSVAKNLYTDRTMKIYEATHII